MLINVGGSVNKHELLGKPICHVRQEEKKRGKEVRRREMEKEKGNLRERGRGEIRKVLAKRKREKKRSITKGSKYKEKQKGPLVPLISLTLWAGDMSAWTPTLTKAVPSCRLLGFCSAHALWSPQEGRLCSHSLTKPSVLGFAFPNHIQ